MLTSLRKEKSIGTIKIIIALGDVEIGKEYEFSKTEMINGALYFRIVTDSGEWLYVNDLHCEVKE